MLIGSWVCSVTEREWVSDYVDLESKILGESDAQHLYAKFPDLPRNTDKDCPTCYGEREYTMDGETHQCACQQQLQLHKHYLNANIGDLYQRLDWEDYSSDPKPVRVAHKYLGTHKNMVRSGIGLFMFGDYGTGKTMVSSLIAKELVKLGYRTFFVTFTEMIDMFTKGWGDTTERAKFERRVVNSRVLVLDDIGKEFRAKNNLAESTFDHVLRQRAIQSRPTFITTNMSSKEVERGYGSAILSLLLERSIRVTFEGVDWRENANQRSLEEISKGWRRPII